MTQPKKTCGNCDWFDWWKAGWAYTAGGCMAPKRKSPMSLHNGYNNGEVHEPDDATNCPAWKAERGGEE